MIYLEDSYLQELETEVESVEGNKVFLKENIFYPESGGQLGDEGSIFRDKEEFRIIKVKKENNRIFHEVDREGLKKGDKILARLNWERRYLMMKSHTAAHILSGVVSKETGALITGNQLGLEKIRIDFSLENFDREKLKNYIEKSNEVIKKDLNVKNCNISREELERNPGLIKLAKGLPEYLKVIRIVNIESFDAQPDGGTHVKKTGEIGEIELLDCSNQGKNNRRVYFKLKNG